MLPVRVWASPYIHPYVCYITLHTYVLGCAFRFVFRFIPVLIFWNSGCSAELLEFHGTHVRIKSFQGKISLLQNSGSGIPDLEFRKEGPVTSATIPYRTTILLQFAHTIQCCLWCLVCHRCHFHRGGGSVSLDVAAWRQCSGGSSLAATVAVWQWQHGSGGRSGGWRQRAAVVEATVAVTAAWQRRRKRCSAGLALWLQRQQQLGNSSWEALGA